MRSLAHIHSSRPMVMAMAVTVRSGRPAAETMTGAAPLAASWAAAAIVTARSIRCAAGRRGQSAGDYGTPDADGDDPAASAMPTGSRPGQLVASMPRADHSAAKASWICEPIRATRRRHAARGPASGPGLAGCRLRDR
jgi:hypothetical protein